jgi:hypothetical protein
MRVGGSIRVSMRFGMRLGVKKLTCDRTCAACTLLFLYITHDCSYKCRPIRSIASAAQELVDNEMSHDIGGEEVQKPIHGAVPYALAYCLEVGSILVRRERGAEKGVA